MNAQRDAEEALAELRTALAGAGIVLPDLGLDVVGLSAGVPMLQLGRAPASTVRRLAAAIRQD